jgi:Fe-S-cluster containining protein
MPGCFRPGEPARAADLLGLTLEAFTARYLATAKTHFGTRAVLPRIVGTPPGSVYGTTDAGPCVFLEAGRCAIYAARPYECAHGNPCDDSRAHQDAYYDARDVTAKLWAGAAS